MKFFKGKHWLILLTVFATQARGQWDENSLFLGNWNVDSLAPVIAIEMQNQLKKEWQSFADELQLKKLEDVQLPGSLNSNTGRHTLNQSFRARILRSRGATTESKDALFIQPLVCQAAGKIVMGMEATLLSGISLESSAFRVITEMPESYKDIRPNSFALKEGILKELFTEILEQRSRPKTDSQLKVKFAAKEQFLEDKTSSLCLAGLFNRFFEGERYQRFPIFSLNTIYFARNWLGIPENPQMRPNRTVKLSWDNLASASLVYSSKYSVNDAVFGGLVKKAQEEFRTAWKTDSIFSIESQSAASSDLKNTLLAEARTLDPDELPEVLAIEQAWLYLDKGRAYGLEIGDRLVIHDGAEPIAGHVVGFYRPQGELKTKLKNVVVEGAVVYVREGQNKTKVGQQVEFDQKKYPAEFRQ